MEPRVIPIYDLAHELPGTLTCPVCAGTNPDCLRCWGTGEVAVLFYFASPLTIDQAIRWAIEEERDYVFIRRFTAYILKEKDLERYLESIYQRQIGLPDEPPKVVVRPSISESPRRRHSVARPTG